MTTSCPRLCIVLSCSIILRCSAVAQRSEPNEQGARNLAQFHERLQDPHRLAKHRSFLFVGEISRKDTVRRARCKSGVENRVAYRVSQLLWIDPDSIMAPGYVVYKDMIDCTQKPLLSPPFMLKSKVIVYCEINSTVYDCLPPVPFKAENLKSVQSWIEDLRGAEGDPVLLQIHDRLKDSVELGRDQPILFLGQIVWMQQPYTGPILTKPRRAMRIKVSKLLLDQSRGYIEMPDREVHAWCNSDACSGAVTGATVIAYCFSPSPPYSSTPPLFCLISASVTEENIQRLGHWLLDKAR